MMERSPVKCDPVVHVEDVGRETAKNAPLPPESLTLRRPIAQADTVLTPSFNCGNQNTNNPNIN